MCGSSYNLFEVQLNYHLELIEVLKVYGQMKLWDTNTWTLPLNVEQMSIEMFTAAIQQL